MPKLQVQCGNDVHVVDFSGPALTIGRLDGNDLVLSDPKASRSHCVVERTRAGFRLRDLGSQNGTWVGERKVVESPLSFGEIFRIGRTYLQIVPDDVTVDEDRDNELPVATLADANDASSATDNPDRSYRENLALRMAGGPLARQLGQLMEACLQVAPPDGAPRQAGDIRLLSRKGQPVQLDAQGGLSGGDAGQALRQLLFAAFRTRATDLHIEPDGDTFSLRFRIDGVLHGVGQVTGRMGLAILNVIKILSQIDIAKKSIVQEGSFAAELPRRRVDMRVSVTPTLHGQKLAMRFLDKGAVPAHLENLGMDFDMVAELHRICEQESGTVILAGPTGSGKTTTLYTALQSIDVERRHVVTIEDPVEYELPKATQISIDPAHDLTFSSVLSSVLRQDPDVILVGEVRDQETARMAMEAATTGHLVLTTIHARDSIGTVFRLLDLGVEPFLVANAITTCISQRLVRTLCPGCKRPYKPDIRLLHRLDLENKPHGDFYEAVGCTQCMNTGYRGRVALFETLMFTQQVRDTIIANPTISDIRKAAGEWMFSTLASSGVKKVLEGMTTVQEIDRVTSN
ncbi:MAG TPA: ATPase, T2SS/T4P/T4SS family [Phycisphaerae bacterium]|nr:ATPase, T2SS/T4P/T4SS family [Phycisphaerae bacterium]